MVESAFYIGKNPSTEAANGISEVSEKSYVPAGRDITWPWLQSLSSLVGPVFFPIMQYLVSLYRSEATLLLSHLDTGLGCSATVPLFLL